MEIFSCFAVYFAYRFGRRPVLAASFIMAGICCLISMLVFLNSNEIKGKIMFRFRSFLQHGKLKNRDILGQFSYEVAFTTRKSSVSYTKLPAKKNPKFYNVYAESNNFC